MSNPEITRYKFDPDKLAQIAVNWVHYNAINRNTDPKLLRNSRLIMQARILNEQFGLNLENDTPTLLSQALGLVEIRDQAITQNHRDKHQEALGLLIQYHTELSVMSGLFYNPVEIANLEIATFDENLLPDVRASRSQVLEEALYRLEPGKLKDAFNPQLMRRIDINHLSSLDFDRYALTIYKYRMSWKKHFQAVLKAIIEAEESSD